MKNIIRSPLFYVGDKYKLMGQLNNLFPRHINKFIEPFVGGGSVFLNTIANEYLVNDIDINIIKLHKTLSKFDFDTIFEKLSKIIYDYGLSFSYKGVTVPIELKKQYVKTYYAKYNKKAYNNLRDDFNGDKKSDMLYLYLLLIYGFNRIVRFNSKGDFNLPVGNVDFNSNVYEALKNYTLFMQKNQVAFYNMDYMKFVNMVDFDSKDYIYFDPPYLISSSEYNKLWSVESELRLYKLLDKLDKNGIRFGITNLLNHKGCENTILKNWAKKYIVYNINSNYISFNDNTIKEDSKEIFVTNYKE